MRLQPAPSVPALLSAGAFAVVAALPVHAETGETAGAVRAERIAPAVLERLRALDPDLVSGREVAEVLARVPAPRIVLFQGSFAPVTMEPFADFLIAMGYPPDRIGHPPDGSHSSGSFVESRQVAGALAWYYEAEGVRPLVIGHSQGGMLVIRVLHDLAGAFGDAIPVWNPVTGSAEPRTAFVDPLTGASRPVVGLRLPYAAAIATGKMPRILLGQWEMLDRLRAIPDSVDEFTGFAIEWDLIAGLFPRSDPYVATGSATVRNVILPATYTHIRLAETLHLATDPVTRAWIEAYVPGGDGALPDGAAVATTNLVHAADIWHSVKRHWAIEAMRLAGARRPDGR